MPKRIVAFAATSAIAKDILRMYAADGCEFLLIARDGEKLKALAQDLQVRGAGKVNSAILDLAVRDGSIEALFKKESQQKFDLALIAQGFLPLKGFENLTAAELNEIIDINYTSVLQAILATHAHLNPGGQLAVISSVAGERGRRGLYLYGSTKAALSHFLDGLRLSLSPMIHVIDIRPGPIDTPMTQHILKKGPLFASSEVAAKVIYQGLQKNHEVIYTPRRWCLIMWIIRNIPKFIFKRLNI